MTKTFDQWWDESGQYWAAAVVENGGQLWTDDADERRELFDRRYTRPQPPADLPPVRWPMKHPSETTNLMTESKAAA